jgi:hypothetical protein
MTIKRQFCNIKIITIIKYYITNYILSYLFIYKNTYKKIYFRVLLINNIYVIKITLLVIASNLFNIKNIFTDES